MLTVTLDVIISKMSDVWDDFADESICKPAERNVDERRRTTDKETDDANTTGCSWGQSEFNVPPASATLAGQDGDWDQIDCPDFPCIYELYLSDKKSILQQTKNFKVYSKNPQKYLRLWFEQEDHELPPFCAKQMDEDRYMFTIDLPVGEHDFTLTSELHAKRKEAIDEVCLDACRMLDICQLLFSNQLEAGENEGEDVDRKRRIDEANKEDDIVFDSTSDMKRARNELGGSDEKCVNVGKQTVNTYDSLMAQWREVNMSILQSKAKLVKLDLSVTKANKSRGTPHDNEKEDAEDDVEVDPLDEFMSNLETKTALSMDDKIEKSRLKSLIGAKEKELTRLAQMIELAKPSGRPK